jgi:hypothetical protein
VDIRAEFNVHNSINQPRERAQADAEPNLFVTLKKFHTSYFLN